MKKRIVCLLVALTMLASALSVTAFAAQGDAGDTIQTKYTYSNNGYTLEKVSHADVAPGQEDGLADYYEYTDLSGTIHSGVIEHTYTDEEWAETEAVLRKQLTARHKDYTEAQIDDMIAQIKASLVGDGCQSYSYSAIGYGDWVYIGTMYGGIGISESTAMGALKAMGLLKPDTEEGAAEYNQKLVNSLMHVLYGDHFYVEHVKPTEGILVKINVKTGESKVLMAGSVNGMETTLRGACEYNDKLYFVGAILQEGEGEDGSTGNPDEDSSGAGSSGMPSIYEIDPNTDKIKLVYQATTVEGYAEMVKKGVFPTLRTIIEYKGSLIASVTDENGAHFIAYTPDADDFNADGSFKGVHVGDAENAAIRNPEFVEIANQTQELFDYPAYLTTDSNYGGTVYQVIEFNGDIYAAINTGRATLGTSKNIKNDEDTGCYRGWAIVKGAMKNPNGAVNDRSNWTWTPIVGNTDDDQWEGSDGARYTFNIDPERYAPGTCTLEVYNGYLYIGDYNDVTLATFGALYKKDFTHLAYNLSQSINLYRLDKDMNVELVVGDATDMFPDGSITGLGSGYYSHSNQYTAKATVWDPDKTDDNDGILFYSTLDESTILRPLAAIMNGDVLDMTAEEWAEKINYLKVLIQLLLENKSSSSDDDRALPPTADELVDQALAAAKEYDVQMSSTAVSVFSADDRTAANHPTTLALTAEQRAELVSGLNNKTIVPGTLDEETELYASILVYDMDAVTTLVDTTDIDAFYQLYLKLIKFYEDLKDYGLEIPEELEKQLDKVLDANTAKQLKLLMVCLKSLEDSIIGCDTYAITTNADGSNLNLVAVTCNGLGDSNNHTMRNFATTDDYLLFCTGNPVKGAQVWRLVDWPGKNTEPTPDPKPDPDPKPMYPTTVLGPCTLHFETNGGSTLKDLYVSHGTTVDLSSYLPTKAGYVFAGWYSDKDLTQQVKEVTVRSYLTVYAKWALNMFTDVSANDWFFDDVQYMYQNNLMSGTSATTFGPSLEVTRGMIVTILYRMAGSPSVSTASSFQDVASGAYYADAVAWAAANGIVTGISSTQFCPNNAITREQFASILFRYAQYKGMDAVTLEENLSSFTDNGSISEYAVSAMNWAVGSGLMQGTNGKLMPRGRATRAQAAAILHRFIEKMPK